MTTDEQVAFNPDCIAIWLTTGRAAAIPWVNSIEFMLVGASAVGIGTALFYDPLICPVINQGIVDYLTLRGNARVDEIVGSLALN